MKNVFILICLILFSNTSFAAPTQRGGVTIQGLSVYDSGNNPANHYVIVKHTSAPISADKCGNMIKGLHIYL